MSAVEPLPGALRAGRAPFFAVGGTCAAELDGMGRYLYIVRHTAGL
ncbi:hypothetical protein [Desulfovibrio sp.]|nr:hypothetical protein [Desulfovibrio sp.]